MHATNFAVVTDDVFAQIGEVLLMKPKLFRESAVEEGCLPFDCDSDL